MYGNFAEVDLGPFSGLLEKKKRKEILVATEYDDGGPCLFSPRPIEDRHACWISSIRSVQARGIKYVSYTLIPCQSKSVGSRLIDLRPQSAATGNLSLS
jgi:hypothetical protein